ncbi:hypothetical protein IEO21_10014 [Rhodonia placenta]|uniref:Retrotransposon gag domain-containing protein n=1 Tax=Rhodonia placenta TaxID=104341 RepID=A0A8H7TXP7_9APHY|nr:hypothetical protein IEO21_10014 [Postia placenta]
MKSTLHDSRNQAPSSTIATDSHVLIAPLTLSPLKKGASYRSDKSNIPSGRVPNTLPDLSPATSLPSRPDPPLQAPASPNLSPVQVKHEEVPISLEELRQSHSLQRPLKRSPSPPLQRIFGPARRQCSPPRLQSLSYITPPLGFLQRLHHHHRLKAACALAPLEVNTSLTTIELKVQVALSLLDGDARTWATPFFTQLVSVQLGTQGVTTPFANEAAFATMLRAHFSNLDNEAAAQVELAKLCADKSLREKRTAAEFSTLFKGPADHSGYGDLELRDKYLSSIPSCIYHKIELETFTTWQDADKHATEVEQEDVVEHVVVHHDHKTPQPASTQPSEKETSLAVALAAESKGTDDSSAPTVRTSLTPSALMRGLRLPRVLPRPR